MQRYMAYPPHQRNGNNYIIHAQKTLYIRTLILFARPLHDKSGVTCKGLVRSDMHTQPTMHNVSFLHSVHMSTHYNAQSKATCSNLLPARSNATASASPR